MNVAGRRKRTLRAEVIATAREMNGLGINRGKSGNVSARLRDAAFDGYLACAPSRRTGPAFRRRDGDCRRQVPDVRATRVVGPSATTRNGPEPPILGTPDS